ncbi:MAG TPA: PorV/PorQ family protein [Candidatus Dormibacteraeota bacterium]|nr:PorV/PorQ family protein [Candidatus Dormibacteraeota bacterium]
MRRLLSALVSFLALTGIALAPGQPLAAGNPGFAFLKLGVGARAMGMGSAYVALADDPTALYWNPAGLAGAEGAQLIVMHNEWIQDFRQEFAGVSRQLGRGTAGFGVSGFYTSEMEKRDDVGNLIGHFGFNDFAVTGAYAHRLPQGGAAGLAVKFIREMIDQETATAVAFDLGGRLPLGRSGVSLGAAVQNLGSDAKFITESFPLPRTVRAGAAITRSIPSVEGSGTLSAEFRKAKGEDSRFQIGGELGVKRHVALRAGAKFGYDEESMSFGLGLMQHRWAFDYALVPLSSNLGTTHFVSVSARL